MNFPLSPGPATPSAPEVGETPRGHQPAGRLVNRAASTLLALLIAACGEGASQTGKPAPRPHLVELAKVSAGSLGHPAERSGSLRALREARIFNEETGRIVELSVREGDRVRAGATLVRLDDALLRAALDKARATTAVARSEFRRNQELVGKGFVSGEAETRARAALEIAEADQRLLETRLSYMTMQAPFAGVVSERRAEPGDVVAAHSHLLTLVDLSQLITDVSVTDQVMTRLSVGGRAEVQIDALGDRTHPGRIVRIHPGIDPQTRMGRIEVALDPLPAGARPGQFCRVVLRSGDSAQTVAPLAAIQRDARDEFVYLYSPGEKPDQAGTVKRRPIRTGLRLADQAEILDGLAAGDVIVTKGFLGLADGKAVQAVRAD